MSDVKIIFYTFIYNATISQTSLSLGLTSNTITQAQTPEIIEDLGILEALWGVLTMVINNLFSFFQLMSLDADIPDIFSFFLVYPVTIVMLFVIMRLIRGYS